MKIACVLGPKFEDSEFKDPYDAFRKAGNEITIVGLEAGAQLEGDKGKVKATVDRSFRDVKPDDFDALFIPGGSSPDKLRAHDEAVAFVDSFMKAGKPVLAICHGPQLLLTAAVLEELAFLHGFPHLFQERVDEVGLELLRGLLKVLMLLVERRRRSRQGCQRI